MKKYSTIKTLEEHIKYARTFKSRLDYERRTKNHPEGFYRSVETIKRNLNCTNFNEKVGWPYQPLKKYTDEANSLDLVVVGRIIYERYKMLPNKFSTLEAKNIWKEDYLSNASTVLKRMCQIKIITEVEEIKRNTCGRRMKVYAKNKNASFKRANNGIYIVSYKK